MLCGSENSNPLLIQINQIIVRICIHSIAIHIKPKKAGRVKNREIKFKLLFKNSMKGEILMKKLLNINCALMLLIFTFLMGGCAPRFHKPLVTDLANNSYNVQVLSKVPTKEISIHFTQSNVTAGSGSILFMLVEIGINKGRKISYKERIIPLLEATAGIDFRKLYWNKLEKALSDSTWLKVKKLDKQATIYSKKQLADVRTPFLELETTYELSSTAQLLIVRTKANLYLNDLKKVDYFGSLVYYSKKIGTKKERDEEAVQLWAANNAEAYLKVLNDGIQQNINMLKFDLLDNPANPETESYDEGSITYRDPLSDFKIKGRVLSRNNDRILMRLQNGNLVSIATSL